MDRKVKGYTVIEIVVVMTIISILAGTALIYLVRQMNEARLRDSINLVIQLLEEARRKSTTHEATFGLALQYNGTTIQKIKGDNNCQNREVIATINLPPGVVSNREVVLLFDRMGYPRNASCGFGAERIEIKSQPLDRVKSICINRYGRIRVVEGSTCPPQY